MKQISQNYKTGQIKLENVKPPMLKRGGILVRTEYSLVSFGTESMKVRESKLSYLGKARARPDQVKKVVQSVKQQGLMATYEKVTNKLDTLTPLGYSLSGTVIEVGAGAEEYVVGQKVACGGAGYANHAEVVFIPKNLVIPVPDAVSMPHAAYATVGAIAMQGFRQSEMQLGEVACVVGLGLLGQLLVQILKAAGIRVVGIDIVEERCTLAMKCGADTVATPDSPVLLDMVKRITGGIGIDCIFISAGGTSNKPVELAVEIARDRARVVDIGKTRLDLPWNKYYEKELDVRFSRSYGPGRYDPNYEEGGIDYPVGYVRWTEQRNMFSFLGLVSDSSVNLEALSTPTYPFSDAESIYQDIADGKCNELGILFKYDDQQKETSSAQSTVHESTVPVESYKKVNIAAVGAGNYASSMLLPHFSRHPDVEMVEVATATSLSGEDAKRKFGFLRTTTDYHSIFDDSNINLAVITTRHASHPVMASEFIHAGKTVFVEKPLAIDMHGAALVRSAIIESGNDRIMVGFNRRFSKLVQETGRVFSQVKSPLVMFYRVHAGQLEPGSWYLDQSQGSRFVGEAGHFIDVFSYISGSRPVSVVARSIRPDNVTMDDLENISVIINYKNGTVGNLLYLTQGGAKIPKEYLEVFGGGCSVQLNNFENLVVYEGDRKRTVRAGKIDKGQKAQILALIDAVIAGAVMPISVDCLLDTTLATLAADESLRTGEVVLLSDLWEKITSK